MLQKSCSYWLKSCVLRILLITSVFGLVMPNEWPTLSGDLVRRVSAAAPSIVRITDVSPDRPWGDPTGDSFSDSGGQVDGIAIDPNHPWILYAATENAGVWKSTDAAHSWQWSSVGLRNGSPSGFTGGPVLAVDDVNNLHLLFASDNDDFRPGQPLGGLYISTDAAAHWSHVDLPGCASPSIQSVAFSSGTALAATRCGLFFSADLTTWSLTLPGGRANPQAAFVASLGTTVDVCAGTSVWQSTQRTPSTFTWTAGAGLPGPCVGIAIVPDDPALALVLYAVSDRYLVGAENFTGCSPTRCPATFTVIPPAIPKESGSGQPVLATARRARHDGQHGVGISYDVFAGNRMNFYQFRPGSPHAPGTSPEIPSAWAKVGRFHVDTHGFVTSSTYDPENGGCIAYAATDGGVFANTSCGVGPHEAYNGFWVRAMHGLHAFGSFALAGDSQHECATTSQPCPALYLASNDNGTWGTLAGGNPGSTWKDMGCCGDSGNAFIDAALITQTATFRNNIPGLYRSTDARPPVASVNSQNPFDITASNLWSYAQVMTLPGLQPKVNGDYLAIRSPFVLGASSGDDTVVRNTDADATRWDDMAPSAHFQLGAAAQVQAAGGHSHPTVYVLTVNDSLSLNATAQGKIWKGTVNNSGVIPAWSSISNGVNRAYNLFVDPYDANDLYISDLGAGNIKSSRDGGQHWVTETVLTQLTTRFGEFKFDCGDMDFGRHGGGQTQRYACPLNAVVFVPNHPEIRVAVLHPGGVAFSRDAGAHWIPLDVTTPIDSPFGAFYDPELNPSTRTPSLYIALHGRGLIRVDAPFDTLVGLTFELHLPRLSRPTTVDVVDQTTGLSVPLTRSADGVYRGIEYFDSATVLTTQHEYRYLLTNTRLGPFRRTLSAAEIRAGVAVAIDNIRP